MITIRLSVCLIFFSPKEITQVPQLFLPICQKVILGAMLVNRFCFKNILTFPHSLLLVQLSQILKVQCLLLLVLSFSQT